MLNHANSTLYTLGVGSSKYSVNVRLAGDRAVMLDFGDRLDLYINLVILQLYRSLRSANITGITDLVPELLTLQVSYEPDVLSLADLKKILQVALNNVQVGPDLSIKSRLVRIPVVYGDTETQECINEYRAHYPDKTNDLEYLCEINQVASREDLFEQHAAPYYFVAALGFWPGLCSLIPLTPTKMLTAPKYNPPRMRTPQGAIGIGGALTCIYPDDTPGGYQLIGRTPVPTIDRSQRLKDFTNSMALFNLGDRVKFEPIIEETAKRIAEEISSGDFRHQITEDLQFPIGKYI